MALVATDWTIDRATGNIRYVGDDHVRFGGTTPSYATVIEFHRWLQDLADDAAWTGGTGDELDITDDTPSERATDNLITLINGYNIDANAAEHLYDGSIVQNGGADIWDGIVNFGNSDIKIQLIQNGAVLADDWWNTTTGGLNSDSAAGISHRFMIKTRTSGTDIDLRKIIGTARRFNKTYQEFVINSTSRGNNVLALADSNDLNNGTAEGTVSGWTGISNLTEGYVLIDVNNNGIDEPYYSEWNKDIYSINQFYERMKWLTRDGSSSTLYGLNGELFRGITHEVALTTPRSGTFAAFEAVSWSGGTGQMLAIDSTTAGTKMWIQLLTGVPPTNGQTITGTSTATATASGTATERPLSKPFCGASTGSALIGAYGFTLETADLSNADLLTDLDGNTWSPPNNVTFSVGGLVVDEDYVLVGPESGGALNTTQFTLNGALTGAAVTSVVITGSIPVDTPASGFIRITRANGLISKHPYSSWTGSTFTITSHDFSTNNASNGAGVFVGYLDQLATSDPITAGSFVTGVEYIIVTTGTTNFTLIGAADSNPGTIFEATGAGTGTGTAKPRFTTESFTVVYSGSPRSLFIRARDGGTAGDDAGIKTFETTGTLGSGGGSTTVIRTPDV